MQTSVLEGRRSELAAVCRLLEEEKARGAPIAGMIESLNLAESRATLLLRDADSGSSSDDGSSDEDGAAPACDDGAGAYKTAGDAVSDSEDAPGAAQARQAAIGRGGSGGAKGQAAVRSGAQRVVVDLTENAFGNAKQVRPRGVLRCCWGLCGGRR